MRVHPIEAFEHVSDDGFEGAWEGDAEFGGEEVLIVDIGLAPCHEMLDILGGGHLCGALERGVRRVLPKVFVFVRGFHFGTGGGTAEFGNGTIKEIDLVIKVDDCLDR